jgi:DHA1 family bicyclomycin/chloramphenicol resistance-like MFS transporter
MTTTLPETATPGDRLRPRDTLQLVLVLGSLIALGPLTIDTYLPALPSITTDLMSTAAAVQLTLTGTLAGLALGQVVIGPISDAVGRRAPLLAGTALHVLASILCVIAPNIAVLGALRVLQGLGAAAAMVVAMAIVRDLYTGLAAATLLSRLILVMGAAPILAPTLGGAILRWTNWRGVFVVLAVLGVALIVATVLGLRETLPPERRRSGGVVDTVKVYGSLLRDRAFMGLVITAGLAIAAIFAYVSGSSFVLQQEYGLSQQVFGVVFGGGAAGMIAATQFNVRLLRRYSPARILISALLVGSVAGLVMLTLAVTRVGGIVGVLGPLWVVLASVGFALPNAPALALSRHGEAAGTASAMLGAIQFGIGALAAPLVGVLGNDSIAMAGVVAGGMLTAVAVLTAVARPWQLSDVDPDPAAAPV